MITAYLQGFEISTCTSTLSVDLCGSRRAWDDGGVHFLICDQMIKTKNNLLKVQTFIWFSRSSNYSKHFKIARRISKVYLFFTAPPWFTRSHSIYYLCIGSPCLLKCTPIFGSVCTKCHQNNPAQTGQRPFQHKFSHVWYTLLIQLESALDWETLYYLQWILPSNQWQSPAPITVAVSRATSDLGLWCTAFVISKWPSSVAAMSRIISPFLWC